MMVSSEGRGEGRLSTTVLELVLSEVAEFVGSPYNMITMSQSLVPQETPIRLSPATTIRRRSADDLSNTLSSKFVHEKRLAVMSSNLEVVVNGKEVFRHQMKPLVARCGLLVKLVNEAYAIRPQGSDDMKSVLTVGLDNFPGGAEAFKLAARFCVCATDVPITLCNVAMLRCVAEFLEMTEDYGKSNLCKKTESFLKHEVFWNWNDTLAVFKSCEPFLLIAEKAKITQRCAEVLAFQACSSPDGLSYTPSFSSDSLDLNCSSGSNSSRSSVKSPVSGNWWFQDLSSLPVYLMERVVRMLIEHRLDHKNLAKFLLHYLRSSLPPLQFGSYGIFGHDDGSNLLSPGTSGRCVNSENLKKTSLKIQVKILKTVVELLSELQPRSASCRSLFGLLKTASTINACKSSRRGIEKMIGVQFDKATLDNILVAAVPQWGSFALYDVDFVIRLLEHFLKDQVEALSPFPYTHESSRKCDSNRKCVSEPASNYDVNSQVRTTLLRIGELIDKYLAEVAADANLKPAKFRTLAELLPDSARNSSDGLYRAVEIFLEAHPNLPVSEATGLCRVINLEKLGLDACRRVAENPKFPASFVLQIGLVKQSQIRASNLDSCLPSDFRVLKCKPSSREMSSYNRDGGLSRQSMVVHVECSSFEFMVRQNQDLKRNLKKMHIQVAELESTYKRLRSEVGRLFRTKGRQRKGGLQPQQQKCAA